ncbi:DDE-type integrase/transposase/recombinase [Phormidium tenue FACHB-886]|nr:DDE-type integrase/transposase/recombinase [Phormidium tenue FACHB-886]
MAEPETQSEEPSAAPSVMRLQELSEGERSRVRLIETLASEEDRSRYLTRQRKIAEQLGMSVRNVQRLVRAWEREGMAGVVRGVRSDEGEHRLSEEWEAYILETYRKGNRGGRRMTRAQVAVRVEARAREMGEGEYPSRSTVYRVLRKEIKAQECRSRVRSIGWSGEELILRTRDGGEIKVERSNQVWQCDHTKLDLLVVDQSGELIGRPWLTSVVDTHSRCIMGIYLGFDAPSAVVVCLAMRHAILPKHYSSAYQLDELWGTYGIPQYLYTDGGKEFNSQHLEQVASELKIILCQRRYPAEGGIVERPFGTLNSELLSTLPGYTGGSVKKRPKQAEKAASLTLDELEKQLVRYLVERYNPSLDARSGEQSRLGRWEAGIKTQLALMGERELDICLMRRSRRVVYRGGYIQFANLSYRGEHLEGYTGSWVVLRYNPRDITSILIYQEAGNKDRFLSRAHAVGLETEMLSLVEAQAMSRRLRQAGRNINNQSLLNEVQKRDREVNEIKSSKAKSKRARRSGAGSVAPPPAIAPPPPVPLPWQTPIQRQKTKTQRAWWCQRCQYTTTNNGNRSVDCGRAKRNSAASS